MTNWEGGREREGEGEGEIKVDRKNDINILLMDIINIVSNRFTTSI